MRKQDEILLYLAKVESASIDQIYNNVSFYYYANHKKHLGEILSRMVKTKKIERVKNGVFRINQRHKEQMNNDQNLKQNLLFD